MVQGETATRFVLACLKQRVPSPSTPAKLKARLHELAAAEQGGDPAQRQRDSDRAELAALRRKIEKVGENMALAESREERDATAAVFRKLKGQESALDQRIKTHRPAPSGVDPQRQVAAALGTLDRLSESLAAGTADWSAVGSAFTQTNAKLYLRFTEVERGRKRFNVPAGGVVTFGSTPPPGPLYTGPTDRPIIRKMLAAGESVTATPGALPRGFQRRPGCDRVSKCATGHQALHLTGGARLVSGTCSPPMPRRQVSWVVRSWRARMAGVLRSVAWVCVRDGRLLCVRTRGRDAFYLPGGKLEPGETPEAALAREVEEELGLRLDPGGLEPAGAFEGPAHGSDPPRPLRMECFRGAAAGEPSPAREVAEVRWLSAADAGLCAPVAARVLLHLVAAGEVRAAEPGAAHDRGGTTGFHGL